ncbi:MAG: hypothetical protein ABI237_11585 [Ginsengibacter sp.]
MVSNDVFLYSIIALIVWAIIIYFIIQSASKSNKIELLMRKQTSLLARMARKAGVSDEDVDAILRQVV